MTEGLIVLHRQPVFTTHDLSVHHHEVLSRINAEHLPEQWRHISEPELFFDALQHTRLERTINRRIISEAMARNGLAETVTINLPISSIGGGPRRECTGRWLYDEARRHRLPLATFGVELIERNLISSRSRSRALNWLGNLGVDVSLDDYGKHGAALTALLDLPIKTVKFDRSVLRSAHKRPDLLSDVIKLMHQHDLKTVLEGVETESDLEIARVIRPTYLQGYILGRPEPW